MKIGIIIGSNRKVSQSERVANKISEIMLGNHKELNVELFSLRDLNVPLWTQDKWSDDSEMSKNWSPISTKLAKCDGFIVITPEYAGMATPHLKNFLLMCDNGELAHKPGVLVSVSAGMGGSYPIAELRMSGYKNNYINWQPDHLILRNVGELFLTDDEVSVSLEKRIKYCTDFLHANAEALKPVREKLQDLEKYTYGM